MFELLRRALWDEVYFVQYVRGALGLVWYANEMGLFPDAIESSFTWYLFQGALVVALFMRGGDKNVTPPGKGQQEPGGGPRP